MFDRKKCIFSKTLGNADFKFIWLNSVNSWVSLIGAQMAANFQSIVQDDDRYTNFTVKSLGK